MPVNAHTIREISKRGIYEHKKDSNGIVQKNAIPKQSSSMFGYGCVDDTIPTIKKDLIFTRRNLEMIITMKKVVYEQLPTNTGKKRPLEISTEPAGSRPNSQKPRLAPLVERWFQQMTEWFESGQIGLLPECYRESMPTLEDFQQSNTGIVVKHFGSYLKKNL